MQRLGFLWVGMICHSKKRLRTFAGETLHELSILAGFLVGKGKKFNEPKHDERVMSRKPQIR